jgi:hypothetical protein
MPDTTLHSESRMRLELRNESGYTYICDTPNMDVCAQWLKSWLPFALTVNSSLPSWQFTIWAMNEKERELIPEARTRPLNPAGIRELISILEFALDHLEKNVHHE